jgi:hypothetical protein
VKLLLLASLVSVAAAFAACDGNQDDAAPGPTSDRESGVEAGADPPDGATPAAPVDELTPEQETVAQRLCSAPEWKSVYAEYFGLGPDKPGSCTFGSDCHNGPSAAGTLSSRGYVCTTESICCRTLVRTGRLAPGNAEPLIEVLRRMEPDGTGEPKRKGYMPLQPSGFVFPAETIARIRTLVRVADAGPDAGPDADAGE